MSPGRVFAVPSGRGVQIGLLAASSIVPETFDPITDPLVRIEAARLREKLREYYGTEGQSDAIHIDLPKGT